MIFIFILTLFVTLSNPLKSQDQEYIFSNITKSANLSQHFISAIIEDDNGIMWFGTHDGLNYYDGYSFKRFSVNPKDKNSISSNFVTALAKDGNGYLWIGTLDGLNKLDLKTETFTVFRKDSTFNSLGDNFIVDIKYDKRGFLWVATRYDGLYKLELNTGNFIKVLRNNSKISFNFLEGIKEIELDNDGDVWILYESKGIVFYNQQKDFIRIFSSNSPDSKIPSDFVNCISITDNNLAIVDIRNFGIISINKNYLSVDTEFIEDKRYKEFQNTFTTNANDIVISSDGIIFFDNNYLGLFRYDIKNKKFQTANEFVYNEQDSLDKYTNKLFIDSRNNLWVGSAGFGIGLVSKNYKPFINYSSEINNDKFRLTFPSVRSIYEENDDLLYVGGYNGLNKINKNNGTIELITNNPTYTINRDLFGSNDYLTVSFESYQFGGTLYRYNKKSKTFQKIFDNIEATFVRCYFKDSDSKLWLGMMRGLYLYDFKSSELLPFKNDNFDLSNETINQIFEDHQRNIWIATRGKGVFINDRKNNSWQNIKKEFNNVNSLSSNNVYYIYQDSKDRIWLCTSTGLNLFDSGENTFTVFTESDGLPNNVVYNIIEDGQGYFWLSTNLGISRFDYNKKEFWNFDKRDGIACNEQNFRAAHKGKSGTIYFGGILGLTSFNPSDFKKNNRAPKVLLTEVIIIPDNGKKTKLYNAFSNQIILEPNQKTLNLEFTAISDYLTDIKSRYRYKITELNDDWIEVGFKREITLANLSPGEYQLLVSASNNDGVWAKNPLELTIIVRPEFYQTTWFRIIMILIGISIIITFFRLRINFLRQTNVKLEKLVKERTLELEESKQELEIANSTKNKFFSIIAHDLKNPFNALINYSEILLTDFNELTDEEKINFISGIKESSESTYKFLQDLLTWARTQTDKIKYIPKTLNIKEIVDNCFNVLNVISKEKNINLINSIDENKFVYADENMLNTILMNLLSNAIKFSSEGKSVTVGIDKEENDTITMFVKDQGVGISEKDKESLFKIDLYHSTKGTKGETGTGLGLILTHEFVKTNKGKIFVESKEGEGTTFYFTLPSIK